MAVALFVLVSSPASAQNQTDSSGAAHFSIPRFAAGFLTSLAAHESAHVLTSLAMGGRPSFGFNQFRPVIHSGIDTMLHADRQFAFSAAGMTMQLILDEIVLDAPHDDHAAPEFEKGILASGIGTVVFYFTIGRNASVSDVQQMTQNSGISKWTLTAMFMWLAPSHQTMVFTGWTDMAGPFGCRARSKLSFRMLSRSTTAATFT